MKLRSLCVAFSAVIALSCSDDTENHSLNGSWYLTNTTAADGSSLSYTKGDVIWTFNENANTITVKNRVIALVPNSNPVDIASGNYSYSLKRQDNLTYLYIDNKAVGALANTADNLVITNDGTTMIFRK